MSIPKNFNLGYACINTELHTQGIFTSRTLRLATYKEKGISYVKELVMQNLNDLLTILEWNVAHDISFFRISSEMFPFASHLIYGYKLDFCDKLLKKIGTYAKKHKIRVTAHPSHFNNLASNRQSVIDNTLSDLAHHCEIFDRMKLDKNSVLILHGGGTYNDKEATLERLYINLLKLPKKIRNRLVFENCEMNYNVVDLLPISELLQIPVVIDFHHDAIYPSPKRIEFYFDRIFAVWFNRGMAPKVHVSNSVPGVTILDNKPTRRKHSDLITYLHKSLLKIKFPLDVMLECKLKEQSIFILRGMLKKDIFKVVM
jgi:UV DNA damage endonuclease